MSDPTDRPRITSGRRLAAYAVLAAASPADRDQLRAIIDGAACLLDHYDVPGLESARLLFDLVATPTVADAALDVLTGGGTR